MTLKKIRVIVLSMIVVIIVYMIISMIIDERKEGRVGREIRSERQDIQALFKNPAAKMPRVPGKVKIISGPKGWAGIKTAEIYPADLKYFYYLYVRDGYYPIVRNFVSNRFVFFRPDSLDYQNTNRRAAEFMNDTGYAGFDLE